MKGFTALDTLAVAVYLMAVAAAGSSFYRRKSTAREYFLGGRRVSWLPAGISIIAADLSAISVMGSPAWGYQHNLELAMSAFALPLVAVLYIRVFVPFYSSLDLYTAYEYLERRFGLAVRLGASGLFQILRSVHVSLALYAPSLVISFVTDLPVWQCVLCMGAFTTFYATLGGMKAVIWTDVIQFFTVMSGIALVFVMSAGSLEGGLAAAYRTALEGGRLQFLNLSTDPAYLTSVWACLIGGAVLYLAPLATDQAVLQRLLATRSTEDCRRSVVLQSALIVPVNFLLFGTGVALYVFYQSHPGRLAGLPNPDAILPFFAVRELPHGASGFIIAAILAASMAVMSAGINSLTTATTVDFYQRVFRPSETPQHYAWVGRIGTACWGAGVTVLALFAGRLGELALAYNRVSSVISGPLLGVFLLAILTRRANSAGVLAGSAAGGLAVIGVMNGTNWSFFYHGVIGLAVTLLAGYLASYAAPPPPEHQTRGLVWHGSARPEASRPRVAGR
ncbi:MAG: sodium/solute symporter [Bryobacterales bacterium]|nr:sodium/solute symporter [Bryobacterales bacterium]